MAESDPLLDRIGQYIQGTHNEQVLAYSFVYAYDPSSVGSNGHLCGSLCASLYPLQRCRNVCGVVVLVVSAIACLAYPFFSEFTTKQTVKKTTEACDVFKGSHEVLEILTSSINILVRRKEDRRVQRLTWIIRICSTIHLHRRRNGRAYLRRRRSKHVRNKTLRFVYLEKKVKKNKHMQAKDKINQTNGQTIKTSACPNRREGKSKCKKVLRNLNVSTVI